MYNFFPIFFKPYNGCDYIFSLISKENLDSLTAKVIEDRKDKDKLRRIEENRFDEHTAEALNRVSWFFISL